MKQYQWMRSLVIVALVLTLGAMPIWAEKGKFDFSASPNLSYNSIERLRLGGGFTFFNIFGNDYISLGVENALFTTRDFSGIVSYIYHHDRNLYYTHYINELNFQGIYDREGIYRRQEVAAVGATRTVFEQDYYYLADLMIQAEKFRPENQPESIRFDEGVSLEVHPSIFGTYQGYLGSLDVQAGLPVGFADYEFFRVNALLKKSFEMTPVDRLVVAMQAGYINGVYPTQKLFFLGSGPNNLAPNFVTKVVGNWSSNNDSYTDEPAITLDGFQDNVFFGDKMYLTKIEYQRVFFSTDQLEKAVDLAANQHFNVIGKVYTVFGDAWSGEVADGFADPHTAIGAGLQMEMPLVYPDFYFSMNLARGIGEGAATTFGFETGTTLQFRDIFGL